MTNVPEKSGLPILVIIGIAQLAMLAGGQTLIYLEKGDKTQTDVTSVAGQLSDLRSTVRDGFNSVQAQISGLPDQRAAIADLTRRAALTDDHLSALDARASATERTLYQTQLDAASIGKEVNDIKNASGPIRLPRQ
jgi:hypothetical protein